MEEDQLVKGRVGHHGHVGRAALPAPAVVLLLPGVEPLPVQGAHPGVDRDRLLVSRLDVDELEFLGPFDVCPAPRPALELDASGEIAYGGMETVRTLEAYAAYGFVPGSPAEVDSTGFIRSQRVAQVRFQPIQYNPVSGELRLYTRIVVRLAFETSAARGRPTTTSRWWRLRIRPERPPRCSSTVRTTPTRSGATSSQATGPVSSASMSQRM